MLLSLPYASQSLDLFVTKRRDDKKRRKVRHMLYDNE